MGSDREKAGLTSPLLAVGALKSIGSDRNTMKNAKKEMKKLVPLTKWLR